MSTLRRSLRAAGADGQAVITTQSPGYKLSIDDACVDLGRFTRRVASGTRAAAGEAVRGGVDRVAGGAGRVVRAGTCRPARTAVRRRFRDRRGRGTAGRPACLYRRRTGLRQGVCPGRRTHRAHRRTPTAGAVLGAVDHRAVPARSAGRRTGGQSGGSGICSADELGIDPGPALRELEGRILRQESLALAPAERPAAERPAVRQSPLEPSPAMQPTVSETAMVLSTAQLVLASGQVIPVPARGLRIGRMADNDLVIDGVKVSRYHALVVELAQGFAINDLRSTNGILVGGQRVMDSHLLHDGRCDHHRRGRDDLPDRRTVNRSPAAQ